MKQIYYITQLDFLKKNASTLRVQNITEILSSELYVKHFGITDCNTKKNNTTILKQKKLFQRLLFYISYPFKRIKQIKANGIPAYIICYGEYGFPLFIFLCFSKIYNIKIIFDAVEWYEYSHFKFPLINPSVFNVAWTMNFLVLKCDGLISISSFLDSYFKSHGKKSIIVPPLYKSSLNESDLKSTEKPKDNYLNLYYAGEPGKKDLLENLIKSVTVLYKSNYKIMLHIIGVSSLEEIDFKPNTNINNIIFYGRIPQEKVINHLNFADYTILLRDPTKRYAKAGFSTKFVESFACGVPVIANYSSDLDKYLIDFFNGFVVDNLSCEAISKTIIKAYNNNSRLSQTLRLNSFLTYKEHFTLEVHSNSLKNFIFQL